MNSRGPEAADDSEDLVLLKLSDLKLPGLGITLQAPTVLNRRNSDLGDLREEEVNGDDVPLPLHDVLEMAPVLEYLADRTRDDDALLELHRRLVLLP